jgi:hypothetical protein
MMSSLWSLHPQCGRRGSVFILTRVSGGLMTGFLTSAKPANWGSTSISFC